MKKIDRFLKKNNYKYNVDYPVSKLTTIGVGGIANYVVYPLNLNELIKIIRFCINNKIRFEILGNGSNVLYCDSKFKGIIISTIYVTQVYTKNKKIYAMCGTKLPYLSYYALQKELSNFETFSLIPGTIGASICINAGAYGKSIGDVIDEVVIKDKNGKIKKLKSDEINFSYRNSSLKENKDIVLLARFNTTKKEKCEIRSTMDLFAKERFASQPLYEKNFGSIFKNPINYKAYKLIQQANLEDFNFRNIKLSKKHLNFLQITTNNSAKDILIFIEKLREKVYNKVGILLDSEVILVNWRRKYVKRITKSFKW